jgi:spermidine synthase
MFFLIIVSLFIFSGALGLGYQVIWSKYLLDFLGVSAYSYATVLAAFMAGLAIGSRLLGKYADRVKSPLKLYAYLEFGVAIYALIYSPLSTLFASLYGNLIAFTPGQAGTLYGLWAKVLFSAILLLPPTILMGGTYPVLLRFVTQNESQIGRRASQLYAANAFGAVIGTLLMTFMFLPTLGMSASLMLIAICNTFVALVAFLFSARSPRIETGIDSNISVEKFAEFTPNQIRAGLLLIGIEGAIAFAYEIGWTRFFGLILGSSTYSFSVMLAALISGIASGSALLSKFEKRLKNPFHFLGWTQLLAALLVLVPLPFYPYLGWVFEQYSGLLSFRAQAFYLYEFGKLLLCYLIMLPPTIFIGMALPLAVKGFSRTLSHLGQETGRVYSWNTWGNVVGASVAGLFLLPFLGMERLLRWTVIGTLLVGAAFIFIFSSNSNRKLRILPFAVLLLITLIFPSWDLRWLTLVPFRRTDSPRPFDLIKKRLASEEVKYAVDDPAAHVLIKETPSKPVNTISLLVNGKTDASNAQDMTTQVLLGHIPLLLHPDPQDVLIIGLASGVTTGAVLKHPVHRADVVEIVRSMPDAVRFFTPWNSNPLIDNRFHLIIDDARAYLSYSKQKYDIIISEPSNPWMAGTGSLFSKDFYARAVNCLKDGGLYLQWLQAYELSDETFSAVVRSFRTVFPYIYAFQGRELDILFVGSRREIIPNWSMVQQRFNQPRIREDLQRVRVEDLPSLLFLQRYSPGTVDYIASLTDIENTDDNHFLEYRAPRDLFQRAKAMIVDELDERQTASPSLFWSQYLHSTSSRNDLHKTIELLNQPNMASSVVLGGILQSYYYINNTTVSGALIDGFDEMQTQSGVVARLDQLFQPGKERAALSYLDKQGPAIYMASALSKDHFAFWKDKISQLQQRSNSKELHAELRVFWIELLAASNDRQEAVAELLDWVKSPSPPSKSWAVLRGFQLDRKSAGPEILQIYFRKDPSPILERLREFSTSSN